jgi:hypothetical protein
MDALGKDDEPSLDTEIRRYGAFPDSGEEWGYGTYLDLLNWNYDSASDTAQESTLYAAGSVSGLEDGLR